MTEKLQIPIQDKPPYQNNSTRVKIVNDLKAVLDEVATCDIFEVFTNEQMPLVVIRDESDECEYKSNGVLKHSLDIELRAYEKSYKKLDTLISAILERLGVFKSDFVYMSLTGIDKQDVSIGGADFLNANITLNFIYHTQNWAY